MYYIKKTRLNKSHHGTWKVVYSKYSYSIHPTLFKALKEFYLATKDAIKDYYAH